MSQGLALVTPAFSQLEAVRLLGAAQLASDHTVLFESTAGPLRFTLYPDGVRLEAGPPAPDYGLLPGLAPALTPAIAEGAEETVLTAGPWRVRIGHAPFHIAVERDGRLVQRSAADRHFVRRFRLPPLARTEEGWFVVLDLQSGEPVYGLGEKWGRLDRRGQLVESLNRDALGVNAEAAYKNMPFAWSPSGWGAFAHTPGPVVHSLGHAAWSQRSYALHVLGPSLDLFLFAGADGAGLLRAFTDLVGRPPAPPLWSLGVILSRAYYRTPEETLAAAREVRARGMPCDVITVDGRAWQDTDTRFHFHWDPKRYDDPAGFCAALQALDFKICLWEYPLVSVNSPLFAELAGKGWLIRDARTGEAFRYQWDMEPFGAVLTPLPDSGILDFTHPEAYAWWRDQHAPLFAAGVDMLKVDFGEQIEHPEMLAANGAQGPMLRNIYATLYNRCVYEAAARYGRNGAFLFSRAAWIGCQRYPSQWGGDPEASFEGLAASLRGGLSWGLSGGPFHASDVGGFYGDQRDPALYVRWLQAQIFSAHCRMHGIGPREPWSYGEEAEAAARAALRLRYRLLPYLHRACTEAAATGLPLMRAMVLACPEDRLAWPFDSQFFCGPDLLVAPCLNAEGAVEVYLPAGDWVGFPDGGAFAGGRLHRLQLGLAEMAVFARAAAEIPLGPAVEHTASLTLAPDGAPPVASLWRAGEERPA